MMNGAGWFVLGAFTAALVIFVVDTLIEWRQERLDRKNAEALGQIKDAIFNEPLSFGYPIIVSDAVPDGEMFHLDNSYVMSPSTAARVRNTLKES